MLPFHYDLRFSFSCFHLPCRGALRPAVAGVPCVLPVLFCPTLFPKAQQCPALSTGLRRPGCCGILFYRGKGMPHLFHLPA